MLLLLPLALVAMAGPASAQTATLRIDVAPQVANVTAGYPAEFNVTVHNTDTLFPHKVDLAAASWSAADWLYEFTRANLTLKAGGSNWTTLLIIPPADASPGSSWNFSFEAKDQDPKALAPAYGRFNVTVNVLAPPSNGGGSSESAPPPPALTLRAQPASSVSGRSVSGALELTSHDARILEVAIRIAGAGNWSPQVSQPAYRVLHPGQGPQYVSLHAFVPADAPHGASQTFTVTASVLGHDLTTPWTVTSLGPAPTTTSNDAGSAAGDGETTTPPPAQDDGEDAAPAQPTPAAPMPGLQLALEATAFELAPGGTLTTQARVSNTGGTTLTVRLGGFAPATWPDLAYDPDILVLDPGQTRYVPLTIRAPADVLAGALGLGTATATTADGIVRPVQFEVRVVDAADAIDAPAQERAPAATLSGDGATVGIPTEWGVAAGVAAVGSGALVLARRPWREKLLWGAVGLYTRLARPDILGHDERERLYRIVERAPGTHFHALQRELGWNTGTLTYHLRVLERHGFVVSRRDGLYRRFYVQGAAPRKEAFENGPTGLRADVLEAIRNQHGLSQTDLALALGANKQTVNYHVKALERQGLIRVEKRGRETFLYPAAPGVEGAESASA